MAKFFKVIMNILIILYIAALIALFVPPILGVTTVVSEPGTESNMQAGTVAYGTRESISDLVAGDTIISNTGDGTFLYEIVDMDSATGALTVRSENNSDTKDIQLRRTASKLLFTVPYIGYIVVAMHSTEGLIILGLATALLIILFIIAEILCKRAKSKEDGEVDIETEAEQDRKYFRDLAASQGKPNKLDELATITIPPVADLMEDNSPEAVKPATAALDEEIENPELILEPVSEEAAVEETVIEEAAVEEAADAEEEVSGEEAADTEAAAAEETDDDSEGTVEFVEEAPQNEAPVQKPVKEEIKKSSPQEEVIEEIEISEDGSAAAVKKASEKPSSDTSEFSGIGSALESALENEQMQQTQHLEPKQLQPEAPAQKPVEEIELAIPDRSLEELLQEAYTNGEDPSVTKDPATGITFVDYSNCL